MGFSIAEEVKKMFGMHCEECGCGIGHATFISILDWVRDHKCPAQQEAGPRSKRHPESVEEEGSRGGGE